MSARLPILPLLLLLVAGTGLRSTAAEATSEPPDALKLRMIEWIPTLRQVRLSPVRFPETTPVAGIHSLAFAGDRLWIAAGPWTDTNLVEGSGRLWSFRPSDNRIEPVRGAIEANAVSGMLPRGRQLWMSLDGGLASLDVTAFTLDPFGSAQGFTSPRPVGVADTRRGLLALGDSGTLFRLSADQRTFLKHEGAAPVQDPRDPSPWKRFAGSGDWVAAATDASVSFRHADAPRWTAVRDVLKPSGPELDPVTVSSMVGDGEGRFWIGTDAGLWSVEGESGRTEGRERIVPLTVPGGLGFKVAPGMKPTASAHAAAKERIQAGIRERMKLRARYTRVARDAGRRLDPVTPRSRIPGAVTALAFDRGFLWIATADPSVPGRSRILLFHPGSRKWVGGFPIAFPVRCLTADDRYLWIGVDARATPGAAPLYAAEKSPILSVPSARWTADELDPADVAAKLAALPSGEQRVHAFFSGDYARVLALSPVETVDEEGLFLRALSHDSLGLDIPVTLESNLRALVRRFPDGIYSDLASHLLASRTPVPARPASEGPETKVATPAAAVKPDDEDIGAVMERRDLNGDGKLNIVELRLWLGPGMELAPWDANRDGALDRIEVEAMMRKAAPKATN